MFGSVLSSVSDVFAAEMYVLAELSFGLFVSEAHSLVHFVRILREIEKDDIPLSPELFTLVFDFGGGLTVTVFGIWSSWGQVWWFLGSGK